MGALGNIANSFPVKVQKLTPGGGPTFISQAPQRTTTVETEGLGEISRPRKF